MDTYTTIGPSIHQLKGFWVITTLGGYKTTVNIHIQVFVWAKVLISFGLNSKNEIMESLW